MVEISPNHVTSQSIATKAILAYIYTKQNGGHVCNPTDNPIATRLGLCSSLKALSWFMALTPKVECLIYLDMALQGIFSKTKWAIQPEYISLIDTVM